MSESEISKSQKLRLLSQRMHHRVNLRFETEGADALRMGAEVIWPNGDRASIFDLSYTGAASQKKPSFAHKPGEKVSVQLDLGTQSPTPFEVEVVWSDANLVGMSFCDLSSKARVMLNSFLDNKLLGASLAIVAKNYYGPTLDCDEWHQGNLNLNVYIWRKEGAKVDKLVAEVDGRGITYDSGAISYMDGDRPEDLGDLIEAHRSEAKKFVQILGQIPDENGVVRKVIKTLSLECS